MELASTRGYDERERRIEAIVEDVARRRAAGEEIPESQILDQHPDLLPELEAKLRALGRIAEELDESERNDVPGYGPGDMIAHFHVEQVLGQGHFGTVYLARDENLDRRVAIKIPRPERLAEEYRVETYLEEARRIARLDTTKGIVPVYHADRLNGSCFVVYAFVDGGDLRKLTQARQLSQTEAAELIAQLAETLQYVHEQRIYHRDIKPANIFIDANTGRPYLGDFGLALTDEDFGKGPRQVGTVLYASPEQARGESHLVDGRSDLFSLGVVFYELLTGELPFQGDSPDEVRERIIDLEPRPPRSLSHHIDAELQRICLKSLSKRATDRYTAAADMAEDLQQFLAAPKLGAAETPAAAKTAQPLHDAPIRIVPKGLRSFDAGDADFFLELLPGPRDRDGLPESIRFWKTQIDQPDPDKAFTVGVIYGPSGCGKSSLVQAGLLPCLSRDVLTVYVEASAVETEARLLRGLGRRFPALPPDLDLRQTLAALRRGQGVPADHKVLIVLDHFEQWLQAQCEHDNTELAQALRQCDGKQVQTILAVRDDFWMSVTRFMQALEIDLVQGRNMAVVDLFGPRHAKKVLTALGEAFGALSGRPTRDQEAFLDASVAGLTEHDKIVPVRLALFAEMVKDRDWGLSTLNEIGGTKGVAVAFLAETFGERTCYPQYRAHEKAARAVLKYLLPPDESDLKGTIGSREELLVASGYARSPADFESLVRALDTELRLITPCQMVTQVVETGEGKKGERYYHLTHDYLVEPLRQWLTNKERETFRGRARLRLAERAAVYELRPAKRNLPTCWEWLDIVLFTNPSDRRQSEYQKMMRAATRRHILRGCMVAIALAVVAWLTVEATGRLSANAGARAVAAARTEDVVSVIESQARYRRWLNPLFTKMFTSSEEGSRERLHASLALHPVDSQQTSYLYERLLLCRPGEFLVIRNSLRDHGDIPQLVERLREVVSDENRDPRQRFRAVLALAELERHLGADEKHRWHEAAAFLAEQLVADVVDNPSYYRSWVDAARPVRNRLITPLISIFRDKERPAAQLRIAAAILAKYAAGRQDLLAELLLDANPEQYRLLLPTFSPDPGVLAKLIAQADNEIAAAAPDDVKDAQTKRKAAAAVLLFQRGNPEYVWPLLQSGPDPQVRTYLIQRLGQVASDGEFGVLLERLEHEAENAVRSAIALCVGTAAERLSVSTRSAAPSKLAHLFQEDSDPGVHSAAEWALRKLGETDALGKWSQEMISQGPLQDRGWFIDREGHTMAVIEPAVSRLGSPEDEAGRDSDEILIERRITRRYAIGTHEVSVRQFRRFEEGFRHIPNDYSSGPAGPINAVTWYDAVRYCRWLSEQHGMPEDQMCYPPVSEIREGMETVQVDLGRTGYRLPTEAEWEYACRAGTATARPFGNSSELLGEYAWYRGNSRGRAWPVGSLKPNGLGLFNPLGNVREWCQDEQSPRKDAGSAETDADRSSLDDSRRVVRGGAYGDAVRILRSASRRPDRPGQEAFNTGFRVARTLDHPD